MRLEPEKTRENKAKVCVLCFKYRVYPSKKQQKRVNHQMSLAKRLYNLLLEKAKEKYKFEGKAFRKFDMNNYLIKLKKERPEFKEVYSQVLQNVCDRVSKAYSNFFKRVKRKKVGVRIKVGFPRFKKHVSSLTYPQSGFGFVSGKKLQLSKVGGMPLVLHRLPQGKLKTLTIKKHGSGKWFVILSCETLVDDVESNKKPRIGLDVGLTSFATLSDGSKFENPRNIRKSLRKLKRRHKRFSRKQKGSENRRKARLKLANCYEKVHNNRSDFLHKLSHELVNSYSMMAVENLNVQGMVKNNYLSQSIYDASWSSFAGMLQYKALSAGCEVVFVDAKNTTKTCSACGNLKDLPLRERVYACPVCGLNLDRDVNAAKVILDRATAGLAGSNACGDHVRPPFEGAGSFKARTIRPETGAGSPRL